MVQWRYINGKIKLVGLLVVLPVLLWFAGYQKTVGLWWKCRSSSQLLLQMHQNTGACPVGSDIRFSRTSMLNDGKLLGRINELGAGQGIKVIKYTPVLTLQEDGIQIHTGELILSGSFHVLLKITDRIERECLDGRIASLLFRIVKDQRTREEQLQLTIWIQQITEC